MTESVGTPDQPWGARPEDGSNAAERLEDRVVSLEQHREHLYRLEPDLIADVAELYKALDQLRTSVAEVNGQLRARPARDRVDDLLTLASPHGTALGFRESEGPRSDSSAYADFEAVFRGAREEITRRQSFYASLAERHLPIVDLGCGRGEFLEVLSQRGVDGRGWDLDEGMVREAGRAGLDVTRGDLFTALAGLGDESVGTIFSAQVVEHLAPSDMPRLFTEAHRVLSPQGMAIIETVNPHSVEAFRFFWLDYTHTIPVYPESALMMARAAGFSAAVIVFPGGQGRVDDDLAACGDFAIVCSKDPNSLVESGLISASVG